MKRQQMKPLEAYGKLDQNKKRLLNKLIVSLYNDEIDSSSFASVNREVNKMRRGPNDGRKKTNGYLSFYKERYGQISKENPKLKVTEIGKLVGKEWKSKSAEEKTATKKETKKV